MTSGKPHPEDSMSSQAGDAPQSGGNGSTDSRRALLLPPIHWGAVAAAVSAGILIQFALALLGIATGLSVGAVRQAEALGIAPLLWAAFGILAGSFVGGYLAARSCGLKRKTDGVLHGAVTWAVSTVLFAVLATSIGGALVRGVFSGAARQTSAAATPGILSPLAAMLRAQRIELNAAALRELQQDLAAGRRDSAIAVLAGAGVETARAATLVDQALVAIGAPREDAGAQRAMYSAGPAAWMVLFAVALALGTGMGGGMLGAAGARHAAPKDRGPVG